MCKVCDHPNHSKIDAAIVRGMKYPTIFHQLIKSGDKKSWVQALKDHKRYGHVKEKIKNAIDSKEAEESLDLQKAAAEIFNIAKGSAEDARREGDYRAVGSCLGPAVKVLEILGKGPEKPNTPQESALLSSLQSDVKETFKDDVPVGQAKPQAT